MPTINNKFQMELEDGSIAVFHPETNTGQIYDFKNGKWLDDTIDEILNVLSNQEEIIRIKTMLESHTTNNDIHVTLEDKDFWNGASRFDSKFSSLTEVPNASTTTKGLVQLSSSVSLSSETTGASSNAVKSVNDSIANHANNGNVHVTQDEKNMIANAFLKNGGHIEGRIAQNISAGTNNSWGQAHYVINNHNSSQQSELPRVSFHSSGAGVAKQIAGDHVRGGISVLEEDGISLCDFNADNVRVQGDVYVNGTGLFQSVSNGKSLIANAITGKGIWTDPNAEFATMVSNINAIQSIASGTTSFSSNGVQVFFNVRGLSFTPSKVMFSGAGSIYIWGGYQGNAVGWFHGVDNQILGGTSGMYTDGFTVTMVYPSGSGTVTWYAWR